MGILNALHIALKGHSPEWGPVHQSKDGKWLFMCYYNVGGLGGALNSQYFYLLTFTFMEGTKAM